jgi:glycosyl transferase family 25
MKVFVINLEHEYERRKSVEKQLVKYNIDYSIMPAVNGKDLSDEEVSEKCDMQAVSKNPLWLSRGAIGCFLSHLNLYQKIVKEKLDVAVILEDDVIISDSFPSTLEKIQNSIKPDEVIMLYYQSWQPLKLLSDSEQNLGECSIYQPQDINQIITTGGYVITHNVAKNFLEKVYPIDVSADSWGVFHRRGILSNIRCVYPRVVNVLPFKSSIEYIKSPLLSKVSKLINGFKIPGAYHFLKAKRSKRMKSVQRVEIIELKQ